MSTSGVDIAAGAARGRGAWLRHERMTVAMAPAERTHHSSRGQTINRAGVGRREMNYTATPQPELFSLEEEPGGVRPDWLFAVSGPQARVQRRTVQQIVDFALWPTLDDPAPQMVDQLVDVLKQFDFQVPDAAGGTAGGSADDHFLFVGLWSRRLAFIPVVGGSGAGGGLSGFLPEHYYSMTAELIVDNPVRRPVGAGDLQGFPSGQGSTAFSIQVEVKIFSQSRAPQ